MVLQHFLMVTPALAGVPRFDILAYQDVYFDLFLFLERLHEQRKVLHEKLFVKDVFPQGPRVFVHHFILRFVTSLFGNPFQLFSLAHFGNILTGAVVIVKIAFEADSREITHVVDLY